jgi:hypothetical protein
MIVASSSPSAATKVHTTTKKRYDRKTGKMKAIQTDDKGRSFDFQSVFQTTPPKKEGNKRKSIGGKDGELSQVSPIPGIHDKGEPVKRRKSNGRRLSKALTSPVQEARSGIIEDPLIIEAMAIIERRAARLQSSPELSEAEDELAVAAVFQPTELPTG